MRTILIVEDEWAIANWLEVLLSEQPYHVLVASNGRQALDILHRETPDLVLTDFMMPFIDGAALTASMGNEPRTAKIPIIFMTSLTEAAVQERSTRHSGFIRKPFREADLITLVRSVLPD